MPACVACGEAAVAADGYCGSCGHRQPDPRHRAQGEAGGAVALTDRGLRHHDNEDAFALAELPGGVVLVVCDGVSSTAGSADASQAAATAAATVVVESVTGDSDAETVAAVLARAVDAAQDAAAATAHSVSEAERAAAVQHGPPSSTLVAAVAVERSYGLLVVVAWLGDSRAYWVGAGGASLMTTDHEIEGSLVRWLGADSGRVPPDIVSHSITGPGRLVLCSDGMWRYAKNPADLQALVALFEADGVVEDGDLAQRLVDHAIQGGGHDNITVAVWSRRSVGPVQGEQNAVAEQAPVEQG